MPVSVMKQRAVYSAFISGRLCCLVSTIAFGMVGVPCVGCGVHVHVIEH